MMYMWVITMSDLDEGIFHTLCTTKAECIAYMAKHQPLYRLMEEYEDRLVFSDPFSAERVEVEGEHDMEVVLSFAVSLVRRAKKKGPLSFEQVMKLRDYLLELDELLV